MATKLSRMVMRSLQVRQGLLRSNANFIMGRSYSGGTLALRFYNSRAVVYGDCFSWKVGDELSSGASRLQGSLGYGAWKGSFRSQSTVAGKAVIEDIDTEEKSVVKQQGSAMSQPPQYDEENLNSKGLVRCFLIQIRKLLFDFSVEKRLSMASSSDEGVQEVPGSYGLPIIGAIADRFDYFVKEGVDAFFKKRIEKYKSTVFRVNMPPGPPLFPDPRVIILLDAKSFPILFDVSKVEKKNVFTGVYMPSTNFTGGYRVLSYLDPSEENHTKLKNFCFHVLKTNATKWFPEFERATGELWAKLDKQFAESGKAEFNSGNLQMCFNFLCRSVLNRDPADPGTASLGTHGPTYVQKWIGLQLAPIASTGVLPKILEEVTIHAVPLPSLLVRGDYNKVYDFFWTYGKELLDAAEQQFGLKRDEACHNLVFNICFNTFGGMFVFFPSLIQHIAAAGKQLHADLAEEVRAAIKDNGGLNMRALESMALVRSTVYETLRIDPPVPFQYGHAKEDLVVESHDGKYAVKKGEMLGGYQPFATRDPKVFDNPEEFIPRRFMGEEGEKLLKYVLWSNGPETEQTTAHNKQCAGKNFVVMISRLLVAHLFAHYDFFEIDTSTTTKVVFTSLQKATS